ncbi:MAG: hypothetical protein LBE78_12435 [Burkholderiaceae bacterium]|jgi:hypothetical protein|nr:hypothetical protein [Burkholderiaceae bacterium]
MRAYNVSEFRENLARMLDLADLETVIIKRKDKRYAQRVGVPAKKRQGLGAGFVPLETLATLDSILEDIQAARERATHT